jgi:signal transduction histidine kinase
MRTPHFTRKRYLVLATLGILLPTVFLAGLSVQLQREMFGFQNRILDEYAHFSVDYAVSEVQDLIRAREREIHMHYRMAAVLQEFDPGPELRRIQDTYPMIDHAFLMRPDRSIVFADEPSEHSDAGIATSATAVPTIDPTMGSLVNLAREHAEDVLLRVLDEETFHHLLGSGDSHFFREEDFGSPWHMAAFGLFGRNGETYGVAGFFLKLPYVREKFLASVVEEAIEAAEGRFSPSFGRDLTFVVHDHRNELVYVHRRPGESFTPERTEYLSTAELWDVLPGWSVRLVYNNPKGPHYQRNIWLSNTLLLVLMGTMAVLGILFSMRFMLRQMELSNLKSHFVSNITHELKTPLAAIRLYTETLQQRRVRDQAQEDKFLGIINKETVRLTHLINNILDFSRIEQGRKRYTYVHASVGDVVREVVDAYAFQLRDKGFDIRTQIQDGLPRVWVDRDAVSQAVLNLVDNSVKYSRHEKEIEIRVAHENGVSGSVSRHAVDGFVRISVRDRGVGIPAAEQSKVFEAFYRIDKGLEHDVKGSGLGLAVVKHVVEAHGGQIEVDSHPGAGTRFSIRLPVRPDPPDHPQVG